MQVKRGRLSVPTIEENDAQEFISGNHPVMSATVTAATSAPGGVRDDIRVAHRQHWEAELLYTSQQIYNQTFQTIPLLIVASLWYLIVTSVLSVIQYYIERRYARGGRRELPPTPWQRLRQATANVRGRVLASARRSA